MREPLRIALYGPESTGKTSLVQALAEHFDEPYAPEFVRAFWDYHAGLITAEDLPAIARGQIEAEEEAALCARRIVFCDTELLTNVLWADLLFPSPFRTMRRGFSVLASAPSEIQSDRADEPPRSPRRACRPARRGRKRPGSGD